MADNENKPNEKFETVLKSTLDGDLEKPLPRNLAPAIVTPVEAIEGEHVEPLILRVEYDGEFEEIPSLALEADEAILAESGDEFKIFNALKDKIIKNPAAFGFTGNATLPENVAERDAILKKYLSSKRDQYMKSGTKRHEKTGEDFIDYAWKNGKLGQQFINSLKKHPELAAAAMGVEFQQEPAETPPEPKVETGAAAGVDNPASDENIKADGPDTGGSPTGPDIRVTAAEEKPEEEPFTEISGEEMAANYSDLANVLCSGISNEDRDLLAEGATGTPSDPVAYDDPGVAMLIAMHPGFANNKNFIDAMTAQARRYGMTLRQFLKSGGTGLKVDGKAVDDVDIVSLARATFIKTFPLGEGAVHPDFKTKGYILSQGVLGDGMIANFAKVGLLLTGIKIPRLAIVTSDGSLIIDDGTSVRTLLARGYTDAHGRYVPPAKFNASHAYAEMATYIGNRAKGPNPDGTRQTLAVHITSHGIGLPSRLDEVRDLSIISALHVAHLHGIDLKLTSSNSLFKSRSPINADGTIRVRLDADGKLVPDLSPLAVAAMTRRGINVTELVSAHNKRFGEPGVTISGPAKPISGAPIAPPVAKAAAAVHDTPENAASSGDARAVLTSVLSGRTPNSILEAASTKRPTEGDVPTAKPGTIIDPAIIAARASNPPRPNLPRPSGA